MHDVARAVLPAVSRVISTFFLKRDYLERRAQGE